MRRIMKWFEELERVFSFKTKTDDPLLGLLKSIGFKERGFLSLALDQQFRSVMKKTNYPEYIGILSQTGSKQNDGISATLYVSIRNNQSEPSYSIYLVVSTDSKPICIFRQAPELIIPLMFDKSVVHSMITAWLESIITLYVARRRARVDNEKELKVIEKVL